MKKPIFALGLTALVLGGFTAQAQAQQSAAGTRMGVVNMGLIFTKYEKAKFYKAELDATLKPFKEKGEKIVAEMEQYRKALVEKKVTDAKLKEQYETYLLKLKRDMEDLDQQARKLIGTKQETQVITLYKEVIGAIQGFAQANGYQLIMGYGQPTEGDPYSFANINRLLQGMDMGSSTPLFLVGGVDVSQAIVDTLNAHYRGAGAAAPNTVPAVPTSNQR